MRAFKVLGSLLLLNVLSAQTAQVLTVFPTGSVKQVQQVTVKFSTDMMALGDPRSKDDPFTMTCNSATQKDSAGEGEEDTLPEDKKISLPKYTSRWADTRNWVLDFATPLAAGVRCTFKVKNDLKDMTGTKVSALKEYSFSTSGPALLSIAPRYGDIEPEQYFVASTDGAIDPKSVEAIAYFEVEGMPDKVPVKIITGGDREDVIKAAVDHNWEWNSYQEMLKEKSFSKIKEFDSFLVLGATRRFPENAKVVLHWPKGILSQSGVPVEEAQEFSFKSIEAFAAKFNCERSAPERPCSPILNFQLNFTRRVPLKELKGTKLVDAKGKTWYPVELLQGDQNKNGSTSVGNAKDRTGVTLITNFDDAEVNTLTFKAPFPDSTQFKIHLPKDVKDELGRKLQNAGEFPLAVQTDEYSPLIKFPGAFGILELKANPTLPVSVRNVEKNLVVQQKSTQGQILNLNDMSSAAEIIKLYRAVLEKENNYIRRGEPLLELKDGKAFTMPKPLGEKAFELVGIPLKESGFHVVELSSPRLGEFLLGSGNMYVATAALVTDLGVHLKKGRESSLVWVTQLSSGKSVSGATVVLLNREGQELARGSTNANGTLKFPAIKYPCSSDAGGDGEEEYSYAKGCEVYAFAQKGTDLSFTSSDWSQGIESYRFNVSTEYLDRQWGPISLHTVLDRMLGQPGDAIQMKHILREYHSDGFSMLRDSRLPKRVLVVHQGTQKTYTLPFYLDKTTGSAVNTFTIPKDAALGTYTIYLSNKDKMQKPDADSDEGDAFDWSAKATGQFVVSEYRLPLMKAHVKIQGEPLVRPSEVKLDLSAGYLSGGPAKGLKVKVRSALQPGYFVPDVPGGSDFSFFADPLKSGILKSEENEASDAGQDFLKVQELTLNAEGGLLTSLKSFPNVNKIQQLSVEMEYSDPNGEIKTAAASVPVFPADYVVGLRSDSWYVDAGKTKVLGVITNNQGQPQQNRPYIVEAFKTNYITHRKRLVGGFYAYDSKREVIALGKVCEGKSDILGRFECVPAQLPAGSVTLQARTVDDKQRATYANVGVSIYQAGADSWWVPSDSDRIDLIPEKNRYELGEQAKIIVRSPYPEATALVTVEREGVLDSFVTTVRRDMPIIKLPLAKNYAPNVFVSVLLIRGRVGDPQPTAILDLAKPAMKMGMIELKVGWQAHELLVNVKADKKKYQAREKAKIKIQVRPALGSALPAGTEVAVAAVDESLIRLKENTSWKILKEMMGQRGLAVNTSSGQNQVIGKRHFGSKAKNPGGDGSDAVASNDPRELFEPVLFWQPRVKLNAAGEADVVIPLNDSMTSFRIVAVATSGAQLFGDGKTNIESTKDVMIFSGFAPLVREGDQIKNAFTVRNTTAKAMKLRLQVSSKELPNIPALPDMELKPSEAHVVDLPVTIPAGLKQMTFNIKATDQLLGNSDTLMAKVKVKPAVPTRVTQATLFQLDKSYRVPIKQPGDAIPNQGGLDVHVKATLASGLAGVKSYMEDYGYSCLEQKFSKAIVLEDKAEIKKLIDALPSYLDGLGLLKFFPSSQCGSVQLTHYLMDILHENGYTIPSETRTRLIGGMSSYLEGRTQCRSWWDDLVRDPYVGETKILAMETLSRYGAFSPKHLSTVQLTPNLWKNETAAAWFKLLKRQKDIPNRDAQLSQAENILRSRLNFQGSTMNLQGGLDWEARWRLFTSGDQEALAVFGVAIDEAAWSNDIGRMARGVVARLRQGRWDTTTANAWGVTQLRRFSAKYEKDPLAGETKFVAGNVSGTFKWKESLKGYDNLYPWPAGSEKNKVDVQFSHNGSGKPWVHLQTVSAIPLKAPWDMGYKLTRKITPVSQAVPGTWTVGDVANVEITINAKADQAWVAINDPIPAGASHLGTGLAGASALLDRGKNNTSSTVQGWPTEYEEKSFASYIAYAAYLPRGMYTVSYRIRLNSAGEFKLPPTRVEALYSPETFGEVPNANWKVVR